MCLKYGIPNNTLKKKDKKSKIIWEFPKADSYITPEAAIFC